jgi:anti-sigma B factor antagonist
MAELEEQHTSVEGSVDGQGMATITLRGELDLASVGTVKVGIDKVLTTDTRRVVFDLEELTFMDSSGIALMVQIKNDVGAVEVHNATRIVRRAIEATGLTDILGLLS